MQTKRMALAGAMIVAIGGAALAQGTTAPGSAERNLNNPGSVKSNAEKGMPERDATGVAPGTGPAATGTVTGTGTMPGGDSRVAPKPSEPTPGR
ncbi:hypothetical protein [Methylobacterium nodulans]|uniref:Uncharacterized protein n=1 Tax=Methylobacterium nodulans (strain LMG 21967 / CNCM I-2342 / ORS 2060) TaxID=460265 RepID=B8ILZ5_METNO|nr:hypothetical protein [Methylobacterium nodulans]ACL56339.1 conserved hypothetical protein [Methylobacterium nodulans ORS 2060]